MSRDLIELSAEQWDFLSVLLAFDHAVPVEIVGRLAPLMPGPLFDLIDKTERLGWVRKSGADRLVITDELPPAVRSHIDAINRVEHLEALVGRLYAENLISKLEDTEILPLLVKAGRVKEAAECEMVLARKAFAGQQTQKGRQFIEQAVLRLFNAHEDKETMVLFISAALELSNLCFSLGYGFGEIERYLNRALTVAGKLGDRRSKALIHLHLGRIYYFSDRRQEALGVLSKGFEATDALGDEDILARAGTFVGLFHFIKGHFKEALEHLEKTEKENSSDVVHLAMDPLIPLLLGYAAIHLGQYHRAIGKLDFHWRQAVERSDSSMACTTRAVLGTALVLMKKFQEAAIHLHQSYEEAERSGNVLATYLAGAGITLQYFVQGHMEDAYACMKKNCLLGTAAGLIRQYSAPWHLEMVYEFYRLGFKPIPEFDFPQMLERIWTGCDIHLRGVALRITAREKMLQGVDPSAIAKDLDESEACLRRSEDPVQLSKTLLERARLQLSLGNRETARELIHGARRVLGGYVDDFFPDEFQYLLGKQETLSATAREKEEFLGKLLDMIESLYPSRSQNEVLARMLTATSRMFAAERSGLFWFPAGKYLSMPELRATCNLTAQEVGGASFRESLALILKTFRTRQPQHRKSSKSAGGLSAQTPRSVLCIPIEVRDKVHGVLYYSNSYLDGAFEFVDPLAIKKMVGHTNLVIERRFEHLRLEEQKNLIDSEKTLYLDSGDQELIAQSDIMNQILEQADQIADTESTILILGETGTGKEVLARRIHARSRRAKGAFIVVDATTIPENLMESELFGHERGAFTSADKQKIGRFELANQGTLFLDEVGELSLSAQVKLLRVLQDRTFHRIGGNRTISSDFRLIVATNRDLAAEVAAGRFREDLYYRLSVIPFSLPPLRERTDDIPLLAEFYLKQYAVKYRNASAKLTADQKKVLSCYHWPGNIRELKNILERAVLLSGDRPLELKLPLAEEIKDNHPFADNPTLDEVQRRYINDVLKKTGGKISGPGGAAEILGMKRTSLYARMRALGMSYRKVKPQSTVSTPAEH